MYLETLITRHILLSWKRTDLDATHRGNRRQNTENKARGSDLIITTLSKLFMGYIVSMSNLMTLLTFLNDLKLLHNTGAHQPTQINVKLVVTNKNNPLWVHVLGVIGMHDLFVVWFFVAPNI